MSPRRRILATADPGGEVPEDGPRQRIVEATYQCVARYGLSKTTVEDAARTAGVSRATVYRYFPGGRDELLDAVVSWQFLDFFSRLADELQGATTLEEVLERGFPMARRAVLDHAVLQKILETEPEVLLPKLTVETQRTVGLIAAFLAPYVEGRVAGAAALAQTADYLARMILSLISSPGRWDLEDPLQVHHLVSAELLGGLARPAVDNETDDAVMSHHGDGGGTATRHL